MRKFLNTIWGSYIKILLSAVLTAVSVKLAAGEDITVMTGKQIMFLCIVPVLPIIVNWLNPEDKRYGNGAN